MSSAPGRTARNWSWRRELYQDQTMTRRQKFVEGVRRANAPKPPEHSVRLRVATTVAVFISLAAPPAESEMPWALAGVAAALIAVGMVFSHRSRNRARSWIKLIVAAGAIAALVWFVQQIGAAPVADITGVENPLTVLFAWILVVHSFHVPARRDLMFALGASAALMAVAAAQAVDMRYGLLVVAWAAAALWTMVETWASASGARPPGRGVTASVAAVTLAALVVFLVLPAPTVAVRLDFRTDPGTAGAIPGSGALAGDSGNPVALSRPGRPGGPTRVGGYLGFAGSLDTAIRGRLGRTLIMQVRAQRPTFFLGETYDDWNGQSWSATATRSTTFGGGSPFELPAPLDSQPSLGEAGAVSNVASAGQQTDLQTYYIRDATADLIFHADSAREVWFPASHLNLQSDGTIISPIGLGRGAIYTVSSVVSSPSPDQLRASGLITGPFSSGAQKKFIRRYTELPRSYSEVAALARSVTAGTGTEYDQIQALIAWMGANTRYSTDIPPLPPGADTVDEFLFGNRTGYCEQISTSLAVMLRTLGIPAREAVGYVPGAYNPITDLYEVRAEDAHAWVQAWFPGLRWQSFDPTAVVPDANPSPGGTALGDAGRFLGSLPWATISEVAVAAGLVVAAAALADHRRRRRRTPAAVLAARLMEREGRRAGRPRADHETILEYGADLDRAADGGQAWTRLAEAVDAAAYGPRQPADDEWARLRREAARQPPRRSPRRSGPAGRAPAGDPQGAGRLPAEAVE